VDLVEAQMVSMVVALLLTAAVFFVAGYSARSFVAQHRRRRRWHSDGLTRFGR
jgi:hypothetical protein